MFLNTSEPETPETKQIRLEKELRSYNDLLETDPDNLKLLFNKGFTLNQLGHFEEAVPILERVVDKSPSVRNYMQLGLAYTQTGEYKKALQVNDEVLKINSKNDEAHNCRGFVLSLMGKHKEAIAEYNKAIELNNDYTDALLNLGYSLEELGKHKEAIIQYDKIIAVNPMDCCAYLNKGYSLSSMGKSHSAIEEFEKSISIRPNDAFAHYYKGCAHYNCLQFQDALNEFEIALKLDKNYGEPYFQKGVVLETLGKYNEAIDAYSSFINLNPRDVLAIYQRCQLLQKLGNQDAAIDDYKRIIEHTPKEACGPYVFGLIECEYNTGRYQDVINIMNEIDCKKYMSKYDSMRSEKIRADSYFALKNFEYAFDSYHECLWMMERFLNLDVPYQQGLLISRIIESIKNNIKICLDNFEIPNYLNSNNVPILVSKIVIQDNLNRNSEDNMIPEIDDEAFLLLNRYAILYAEELIQKNIRIFGNRIITPDQINSILLHHKLELLSAVKERVRSNIIKTGTN